MLMYKSGVKTPVELRSDVARVLELAEKENETVLPAQLAFPSWPGRKDKTLHLNVGFVRSQGPLLRAIYHPHPLLPLYNTC